MNTVAKWRVHQCNVVHGCGDVYAAGGCLNPLKFTAKHELLQCSAVSCYRCTGSSCISIT